MSRAAASMSSDCRAPHLLHIAQARKHAGKDEQCDKAGMEGYLAYLGSLREAPYFAGRKDCRAPNQLLLSLATATALLVEGGFSTRLLLAALAGSCSRTGAERSAPKPTREP